LTPHVLLIAATRNSPWCRSPAELMAKGISEVISTRSAG
jgi:hypothetical protein